MGVREIITKALMGAVGGPNKLGRGGIDVYHSSPHTFDKFDLGKIGSGEGAQVYGHGLYFAENPAVSGQGGQYWQQFAPRFSREEQSAAGLLHNAKFDRDAAIEEARRLAEQGHKMGAPGIARQREEALRLLESGQPVGPRTYEANIKADPDAMLDWDRQVTARAPEPVRNALNTIANNNRGKLKDDLWTAAREEQPGWYFYSRLMDHAKTGDLARNQAYASDMLREAGVPGIKYLDEVSRGRQISNKDALWQEPLTSNYVVFDPANIDIRKMYAAPVAAAPVLGAAYDQSQYEVQP